MVEGARLESVYTLTRIEGSNPSLSAKSRKRAFRPFFDLRCARGEKPRGFDEQRRERCRTHALYAARRAKYRDVFRNPSRCPPQSESVLIGEVPEWPNGLDSKSSEPLWVPRVRIPPSPPFNTQGLVFFTNPCVLKWCGVRTRAEGLTSSAGSAAERMFSMRPEGQNTWTYFVIPPSQHQIDR